MDWIREWKTRQAKMPYHKDLAADYEDAFWAEFAPVYDELRCRDLHDALMEKIAPWLSDSDIESILEIGAGTGALTLPLADKVKKVTALDASPHMLKQLESKIRRLNVENVLPLLTSWENAEVAPHDFVLASGCTYGFFDIEKAVKKMCAGAVKAIAFSGDLNRREPEALTQLRKRFHWEIADGYDQPILYNVLYQMGLYPDVMVIRNIKHRIEFHDIREGIDRLRIMLRLSEDRLPELSESLIPFIDADTGRLVLGEGVLNGVLMICPLN
jgi:SAM-dependent methyltransferase